MAETPDKETQGDKQPEAAQQASSRVSAIAVSLAALAIIGAATANSLPSFNHFSLPNFDHFSWPNFDRFALPDFNRFSLPGFNSFTAQPPTKTASAPIPDFAVSATLKEIRLSQQQDAAVLVLLTQSFATQQADLKRISRQLSSLAVQAEALQSAVMPLTTSSIPHSNIHTRAFRTSRKITSLLPKPVGPVSVGGAPLSPAPPPGSGV